MGISRRVAVVVAAGALIASAVPGSVAQGNQKDDRFDRFVGRAANLNGAKEVPGPGDPDGKGKARVNLHAAKGKVCFRLSWQDIGAPNAAHIHEGGSDVAGPVVVGLFVSESPLPDTISEVKGCVEDVDSELVADIVRHPRDYYVNIHNPEFPAGAIRGQLFNP